ncbi:MAG: DNA mismatch repair endonuclease MutL [Erysipelotrichia bacterium]|nr:DNA mismatch repair endonuclease MutL [Erysipelotrichia bacterium]
MGRIRQLDEQTANMIAAGEVVERPMGVVKELVENAIDAGSTRITIAAEQGGIQKITVSDNGCGMDAKDASMAFERHATSKISSEKDLFDIHTLGFRGEALPSIASVSKLTMTTSDGREATRVKIEYGKLISVSSYPCSQGTEISVEGLFYRTPARLKHLKSGAYENSLIQDVISRFAMSHPEIAFNFISEGKESFRTSGQNSLLEVLYACWGREAVENVIPVEFSDFDYKVTGCLVKPNVTRSSRNFMHVFLNGRMVRTYRLYKSIQDGYEDFIVKGRNPLAVLSIEMDAHLLDVNVHPSKWEVRISKENQLESLITENIRRALQNTMLAPKAEVRQPQESFYEPLRMNMDAPVQQISGDEPLPRPVNLRTEEPAEEKYIIHEMPAPAVRPIEKTEPEQQKFPEMQVIGQLHGRFILCAVSDGLAVLDQHACQERVHYEEIRNKLNVNPVMTDLLVPAVIHSGSDLVNRIDEINAALTDLHITMEPFGPDTIAVRTVPLWMKDVNAEEFLQDVLDNFRNDTQSAYAHMEKKTIATMACHHSIRFNRNLTMAEMNEVVRQLAQCENPYHCPHGRPTFVILDEKTLTKEFLR